MALELNERSLDILKGVILSFIKTGAPVGSRTLTKLFDFGLSPATIRNIMADLEEMDYLVQPHPSAGRIPTEKGYRFYVNELLEKMGAAPLAETPPAQFVPFGKTDDIKSILREASRTLSAESHYAGLVLAPKFSQTILQHLQFIKLRSRQVLVVIVSSEGLIQNRVIDTEEDFSQPDLDRFSAYLNERFRGSSLQEVRTKLLSQMKEDKELYSLLLGMALDLASRAFKENQESQLFLEGTTNILDLPEFSNVDKMKALFRAFEEKYIIMKLLDSCFEGHGVQVLIGSENAYLGTNDCSLVIANYNRGDQVLGVLGIIGPTRMEYSKVITLVDHTAKRLSQLLKDSAA